MSALRQIAAIVRADFLIRFRRVSTLVIFLLLSGAAYLWVPPIHSGRAILVINNHRALYNSAALGMSTATLAVLFVGLAGYYVVSNAIRRDITSHTGAVLASTPVSSLAYLTGKFLGNTVFLSAFMGGFLLTSMAMQVVRGEAPLEPLVFIGQYLLLVPPTITFVAVAAIVFESIPFLAGKIGDVLYFFLWIGLSAMGIAIPNVGSGSSVTWGRYLDFSGFGFLFDVTNRALAANPLVKGEPEVSIGASPFDPHLATFVFNGLTLPASWILPRLGTLLLPIPFLLVARVFFHRFDPSRTKKVASRSGNGWTARFNSLARPLARPFRITTLSGADASLFHSASVEARMTVSAFPLAVLAAIGIAIATLVVSRAHLTKAVFPVAFALLAILLSDPSSRERSSGTTGFIFSAPHLKSGFVWWKFIAAMLVSVGFLLVPAARFVSYRPQMLPQLLVGIILIAAAATALGVISSTGKTFLLIFLSFWYIVVNDAGHTPGLDFAGVAGIGTPLIAAGYLAIAALLLATAEWTHRRRIA